MTPDEAYAEAVRRHGRRPRRFAEGMHVLLMARDIEARDRSARRDHPGGERPVVTSRRSDA
jgi:hypothetical protein